VDRNYIPLDNTNFYEYLQQHRFESSNLAQFKKPERFRYYFESSFFISHSPHLVFVLSPVVPSNAENTDMELDMIG
jgi:hypothetical protein